VIKAMEVTEKRIFITLTPDLDLEIWGQCYKTFYGRKLRLFAIS
jgi:hypothetical protein